MNFSVAISKDPEFPCPAEKTGWPWQKTANRSQTELSNLSFPKISIITPSYNQGDFIEQTIRSVLLQDYPNLEYIVIDGGSTDNTLEIIKKYEPWLAYWESVPDRGQSHAINKGLQKASGEWVAWLNTDDLYLEDTLITIGKVIATSTVPLSWIVGTTVLTDPYLTEISRFPPQLYTASGRDPQNQTQGWLDFVCTKRSGIALPQPSSFWLRGAVIQAGGVDERLRYVMDHELYGRLAYQGFRPHIIVKPLAYFRVHPNQKTEKFPVVFWQEELSVVYNWFEKVNDNEKEKLQEYGEWLNKQIKTYPYRSFLQNCLITLKNTLKSKNKHLYQLLKKIHKQYSARKQ